MKILIDAFGGDHAPDEVILGTVNALKEKQGFTAVLVGDETIIKENVTIHRGAACPASPFAAGGSAARRM